MISLNVTEILGPHTNRTKIKREYSKTDKSYIYKVEGQRSKPLKLINLPQNSRGDNLCHYLAIQVRTSDDFTITITIRDDKTNSFNFAFSTFARKTQQQQDSSNTPSRPSSSRTSALFNLDIPRDIWATLYFDIETISQQYWPAGSYQSLDKIEISPTCSVRWVFMQENLLYNETNDVELPKGLEYPKGISSTTIIIPSDTNNSPNPIKQQGQISPSNTRPLNSKNSPRFSTNPTNQVRSPTPNQPPSIPIASIAAPDFNQPSSGIPSAKQKSSRDRRIPPKKKPNENEQKDSSRQEKQISVSAIPVSLKRAEKIEEKYDKEREKQQKSVKSSNKGYKPAFRPKNKGNLYSKNGKGSKNKSDDVAEADFPEIAGTSIKMKKSSLLNNTKNVTAEISKSKNDKDLSKDSPTEFNQDNANQDDIEDLSKINSGSNFDQNQTNLVQLGEEDDVEDNVSGFQLHDSPFQINDDDDDDESDGSAFGGEVPQYENEFLDLEVPGGSPRDINDEEDEEEELELMYISALDCYYCPSNQQYYQIEDGNNADA